MPEPTPESVELARSILEQDGNPITITGFLALTIGQVMRLNYDGLVDIFDARRAEFEPRGGATCCGRFGRTLTAYLRDSSAPRGSEN